MMSAREANVHEKLPEEKKQDPSVKMHHDKKGDITPKKKKKRRDEEHL